MNFADLGLSPETLRAVEDAGYTIPTPIQEQAIPVVLMGRDVLGVAQTGTGKTASFTLPMIDILSSGRAKARMPRSLILCPTRELAAQVSNNFETYTKYNKLTMALLIGGESFGDQEKVLDRGADVLIATPGRLMDMFERGRILLNDVKILVIDEADRMLDMGFIPDVEKIVATLPKLRQTLFFSATMAPEIRRLADAFLMNPKEISVSPKSSAAVTVVQNLVIVPEIDKRETLRHLLRSENIKNALIFCNRKTDVEIVFKSLERHGFNVARLHGDMAQPARTATLDRFKKDEIAILVCSDVAARGLDIAALSHVFNFDVPVHSEDYIHRIGRTGRAGREGRAFTIATPDEGKAWQGIERLIGTKIPVMTLEGIPPLEFEEGAKKRRRGEPAKRGGRPAPKAPPSVEAPVEEQSPQVAREPAEPAQEREPTERSARPPRDRKPRDRAPRERDPKDRDVREPEHREPVSVRVNGNNESSSSNGPKRDPRRRERRRAFDEFGIGEMSHSDGVIGFGDHVPDFILQEVTLPTKTSAKDAETETDAEE